MSTRDIEWQLREAGLTPADAVLKRALFEAVARMVSANAPGAQVRMWWVPGRLEVFGKHTDYAGGRTMVAAIPRGFALAAARAPGDDVHVIDARSLEDVRIGPGGERVAGWRQYADIVVRRFMRNFPGAARGGVVAFASDLPPASGMSSSSALVVALATALAALWELRDRPEWKSQLRTAEDVTTYFASLENGSAFGALGGDAGVGTHGGSEDHAAIMLGRSGEITAWSFVPLRRVQDVRLTPDWSFVLAASGVRSEKTGGAREAYNQLSGQVARLLALWRAHEGYAPSLAAALESDESAPGRLRRLVMATASPPEQQMLLRRLDHFLLEDALVPQALHALAESDRAGLGEISAASQDAAQHLLGNQSSETIALVRLARSAGAFAASSFGAGFGGGVWALTDAHGAEAFATSWVQRYRAEFPARTSADAFLVRPGPPVTELSAHNPC